MGADRDEYGIKAAFVALGVKVDDSMVAGDTDS